MKKKLMLMLSCLFISVGIATAQTTRVSGTVVDETGEPIISASVIVKGTTVGTSTDLDGKFTISLPSESNTLVFHLIGMKSVEKTAKDGMRVMLAEDHTMLEEVVVTGYGSMKKSSFTGSASVISTKGMENIPGVSMESRLAGAAAGVQVGSSTGQPGAMESIRIRGAGSINASNEPLYVIDGVPMQTGNSNPFSYAEAGSSILSTINANDIESFTIIKDAAAASLYGSRAASGVVIITTKQGAAGKTKVSMRADWGFSNLAINYRPTLNGDDRRALLHHGLINRQKDDYASWVASGSDPSKQPKDPIQHANDEINTFAEKPWSGWENWRDKVLRTSKQQNYEVNIQGGNEKTTFYTSIAYSSMDGVSLKSGLDRTTGRLNLTHKVNSRLTVGANVMYTNSKQSVNDEGTAYANPLMNMSMTLSPQDYAYNKDGSLNTTEKFGNLRPTYNPLLMAKYDYNRSEMNRFLGAVNAKYDIYDGIAIKQDLSYDYLNTKNSVWWDPRAGAAFDYGVFQRYQITNDNLVSRTHLTYDKTFNKVHNINALFGYEIEKHEEDFVYASGEDYVNPDLPEIDNAAENASGSGFAEKRMISYVGYANYNYDNRYYFSGSLRRDGSSKLSRQARWGNFWSLSGSWRITEEKFAESFKHILSDAKLRASYGTNGTLPLNNYDYMDVYEYGQKYNGVNGAAEARLADVNLKWEKNYALNIGLDLTFLSRYSMSLELYNRDTKDLILDRPVSQTTGFSKTITNIGAINNRGVELSLKSINIDTKDFTWQTSLNLAHNRNRLKKIDGNQTEMFLDVADPLIQKVGNAFTTFYGFEYAGVDPQTGKESFYRNIEGHEREITTDATTAKKVALKKADPAIQGGITNTVHYKDFDLGFTFTYSLGGHLYDFSSARWIGISGSNMQYKGAIPAYFKMEDIWQEPGDNAKYPRFVQGSTGEHSSRHIRSTDHLRLKNITLGYTLPKHLVNKLMINNARVYASAVNLFTFKKSELDVDPEIPSSHDKGVKNYGTVKFQTPPLRTVTFGVELTF